MKAISLFSGAGGIEIGFDRAGIETVLQADQDPWCLQVLERHWPEVTRVDDVRKVDKAALRGRYGNVVSVGVGSDAEWLGAALGRGIDAASAGDGADGHTQAEFGSRRPGDAERRDAAAGHRRGEPGGIDLVYGGFPCQDVSVAGKRAGLSGERSGLWHEFHRVLRELRPRWVVIENVPGLLSSNSGRDFATVLLGLEELGYGWAYRILDARWFGVPQRRRRVFIVGCLGDARRAAQVLAICESCGGYPQARQEAGEDVAPTLDDGARGASVELPMIAVARTLSSRNERVDAETENFVVASPVTQSAHAASETARLNGAQQKGHEGWGVRRLTPLLHECERLMGWPDEWTRWTADGREISDSHRYRLCGNGVVATVAEWLGHRLMQADRFMDQTA